MDGGQGMLDALIDASVKLLGLTIKPHHRPGIRSHLKAAGKLAAQLEASPGPAEAENAAVFRP